MLYHLLKIPARIALHFYCRKLTIDHPEFLRSKGPLILAANHPNSLLDAIILCSLFKEPIYSLARGDVFQKYKWLAPVLKSLKIYPVYRTKEGAEYLDLNYATFAACQQIFKRNGIVLIFSEGLCENEWNLRPLKKGTARLVMNAWKEGIPLRILPLGLNYSSFKYFGKHLILKSGNILNEENAGIDGSEGQRLVHFNKLLDAELQQLVFEIGEFDLPTVEKVFAVKNNATKNMLLFLPAMLGYFFAAPLYYPLKAFTKKFFGNSGHYDSVLVAPLLIGFPLYVLFLALITRWMSGSVYAWLLMIIIPFCTWSLLQLRRITKPVAGHNTPA